MNQIKLAIEPLRQISIENALKSAKASIAKAHEDLLKHNYNLGSACRYEDFGGQVYYIANKFYERITRPVADGCSFSKAEYLQRKPCLESEASFLKETEESASLEFDKYVAKMISKIGEVESAELKSIFDNDIWGYSFLNVVKDGEAMSWKTQQIINVSKLGKMFNQWPTRKMKIKK